MLNEKNDIDYVICDDTSIFTWTGHPLKIKDQMDRIVHKDIEPNNQHMNSWIVTLG
jgi:hypothetical protein